LFSFSHMSLQISYFLSDAGVLGPACKYQYQKECPLNKNL
jgi:hypothetical protein